MKPHKAKDNLIKEQILERNNSLEKYILIYLLNKKTNKNLYDISISQTIDNINSKIIHKPPLPKIKKISNSRPKICKIHLKNNSKDLKSNSFINYNNNIKYIKNKLTDIDDDDAINKGIRKTIASAGQYQENKENINNNNSFLISNTISNIDLNKSKNFSFINKNNKSISINDSYQNINYFLKKMPKLFNHNRNTGFSSFYSFKNDTNLSFIPKINNNSFTKLNTNLNNNNTFIHKTNNIFDNSFDNNYFNSNLNEDNINNINREKTKTIDISKTIQKLKNNIIYIKDNSLKKDKFIYNKKNNYSSFSLDKNKRNKSTKNNLSINISRKSFVDKKEKEINLEDFLIIIQKFENVKNLINTLPEKIKNIKQLLGLINAIKIKLYDLYKFYFGCSFEGTPKNLFISKKSKITLHYYSIIFVLSLGLLYILTNKVKMSQVYFPQIINLFNFQQKLFLLLSDMVIHKIKINKGQKMWVREIMNILNNKLMFNTENYISDMKKIILNSYYLINEMLLEFKLKNENGVIDLNEQEIFFMNFFFNNTLNDLYKYNMNDIEQSFNNNLFNIFNIKSNYPNITSLNKSFKKVNNNNKLNHNNEVLEIIIPRQKNPIKLTPKVPYLKFSSKKEYTLILDLDETLINFKFIDISKRIGKIQLRPGLINFLEIIKEFYEIIIFTCGTKEYADIILNTIEKKGNNKYFDGRLYREHNVQIGQKFYKDLSKIGRDLSRTIIVDNYNHTFKFQKENGILINSFYGENLQDKALIELQKILIKIYNEKTDVRKSIVKFREEIFRKISYSSTS